MSLQDVRVKLETGLNDIYTALEEKSATIPEQKNLINVAPAIRSITGGGGDNSGEYVWSKYSDYVKGEEIPYNTRLLLNFDDNIKDVVGLNKPVIVGTSDYAEGKFNKALHLDGSSYVEMPNIYDINTGDFTIACWVKLKNFANEVQFIWSFHNIGGGLRLYLNNANNKFGLIIPYQGGENGIYSFAENIENEWTHLAVVRKNNVFTVYMNGVAKGTYTNSYAIKTDDKFLIGAWIATVNGANAFMHDGYIDDLIITKSALWTENFTPPALQYGDTGTFEEYVVSDNEKAYPNNDYGEDGFYYIKEIGGQEPEQPQVHNYLMLYDGTLGEAGENGANVCADVTGGYKLARTDNGGYWTLKPIVYNSDNLFLNSDNRSDDGNGIHYYSSFITKNTLDLTGYMKIGVIANISLSESMATARVRLYSGDTTSSEALLTILDTSTISNFENGNKSCFVGDISSLSSAHFAALAFEEGVRFSLLKMYGAFMCKQDDYQPMLDLAGITTTYTDEASICASQTTMTTILNNKEAIDYMVHNCTGTFMLAFLQSETALNSLNSSPYKVLVYQNDVWIKFLSMVA